MVPSLSKGRVSVEFLDTESQWWQEMYQPGFLPRGIKSSELRHDKGPSIVHCVFLPNIGTHSESTESRYCVDSVISRGPDQINIHSSIYNKWLYPNKFIMG